MPYSESDRPGSRIDAPETTEERLYRENQDLKRQLNELKGTVPESSHPSLPVKLWHPSGVTLWVIFLTACVLIVLAFFAGYIPLNKRNEVIAGETREQEQALPRVNVIEVRRSSHTSELKLPGSMQAVTEAPILARADGYVEKRLSDIGDRVRAGQPLLEIDAPELEEQVRQAKANVQQSQGAIDQAQANLQQGRSEMEYARLTAQRWSGLSAKGIVSKQENDLYQSQYQSKLASVQALEKAVNVQRSAIAASEANVARLEKMRSYRVVRSPFDGVVTLRNVDVGALVTAGSTLLFRVAQTATLRTYVNVPQSHASAVKVGQIAALTVSNLPSRHLTGRVARTASSLDPASRTLLVEIQVPNADGALLPGMYAEVDLSSNRSDPPLLVPGDALIVRSDGAQVAVVRSDHTVHLQRIEVGRDFGDRLEVIGGLKEGDTIIPNPVDTAQEGRLVNPVLLTQSPVAAGK